MQISVRRVVLGVIVCGSCVAGKGGVGSSAATAFVQVPSIDQALEAQDGFGVRRCLRMGSVCVRGVAGRMEGECV